MIQRLADTSTRSDSGPRPREPLSRERIICAARDYIDRECLADLSMRKLGAELGVEAMSLYRYFPSKSQLLDAVVERVAGGIEAPAGEADWTDGVRRFARSLRDVGREHPRIFPLIAASPPNQPAMRRLTDALAATLRAAGFAEEDVNPGVCAVIGFATGSTLWLLGAAAEPAVERVPSRATGPGGGEDFEFGLDVLLAGLTARLEGARATVPS